MGNSTDTLEFVPEESEKWYYDISPPTENVFKALLEGIFPNEDTTWGRDSLPRTPAELALANDDSVAIEHRKVYYSKDKKLFICYNLYTPKNVPTKGTIYWIHGINDYSAKIVPHSEKFLKQGYRLVAMDLVGHGRSSGLHAYVPDLRIMSDAVKLVVHDVRSQDSLNSVPASKTFVVGHSLGGFTAGHFCSRFPEIGIDGAILCSPMLAVSKDAYPPYIVELIGRAIASVLGRLPFIHPLRGRISDDPMVELQFLADCMTYHGKLRIATGLACLTGIQDLQDNIDKIKNPVQIIHGTADRICDFSASKEFFGKLPVEDKEFVPYEGYEHIILKIGKDEADDKGRQQCLDDMLTWLNAH